MAPERFSEEDSPTAETRPPHSQPSTANRGNPGAGRRLGKYRILRVVGEGGMGVVYEAEQDHPRRIVALKEAVGRMERIDALRALCRDAFTLLSGDDGTCLEAMRHGARGVISVASNAVPGLFTDMTSAALRADWAAAEAIDARLRDLLEVLGAETNPIPVKWALREMGLCSGRLRLPLVPLSAPYRARVRDTLAALGALRP